MAIIREYKNVWILSGEERRDHKLSFFERVLLCEVRFLTNNDSGNAKVDYDSITEAQINPIIKQLNVLIDSKRSDK